MAVKVRIVSLEAQVETVVQMHRAVEVVLEVLEDS
jgi:hypothetical protein